MSAIGPEGVPRDSGTSSNHRSVVAHPEQADAGKKTIERPIRTRDETTVRKDPTQSPKTPNQATTNCRKLTSNDVQPTLTTSLVTREFEANRSRPAAFRLRFLAASRETVAGHITPLRTQSSTFKS
jgi:hypothetical protein